MGGLTGTVLSRSDASPQSPLSPIAGVVVTAATVDGSGTPTDRAHVMSGTGGDFTFSDLPVGEYYLRFDNSVDPSKSAVQWLDQTDLDPYGDAVQVFDGEVSLPVQAELDTSRTIGGVVTCELCSAAPDPLKTTIVLSASKNNAWTNIRSTKPDSAGHYSFTGVWPADGNLNIDVLYSGSDSFAADSPTMQFTLYPPGDQTKSLVMARHIAPVAGVEDGAVSQISALYSDYLHRIPTSSDIAWQATALQSQYDSFTVAKALATSDEFRLARIDDAYESVLGRASDPGGRLSWLNAVDSSAMRIDDIEIDLYGSQEYFQSHGNTNTSFLAALYSSLLNRNGSASDYSFWSSLIAQHGRAWVVSQFWNSDETIQKRVTAEYLYYTGTPLDPSQVHFYVYDEQTQGDEYVRAEFTDTEYYWRRAATRFIVY